MVFRTVVAAMWLLAACTPPPPATVVRPAAVPTAASAPAGATAATTAPTPIAVTPTSSGTTAAAAPARSPAAAEPTASTTVAASARTATAGPTLTAAPTKAAASVTGATPVATVGGPRGTAVRAGNGNAQRVVSAPGAISYAVGPGGIYRLEAGTATPIDGTPGAVELVALGEGKLVTGRAGSCMVEGPTAPLRYSHDGGRTWADAMGPTGRGFPASPRLGRGDDVFALYCGGVLWSSDGGRRFVTVPPLSPPNFEPRDFALSPDGSTAYVAAVSEGGTLQVYRSVRAGATWGAAAKIDEGWGLGALAIGPDAKLYLGTARGVKSSADRGQSWQPLNGGLGDVTIGADPAQGGLSAEDERKMREGVGINALALLPGGDLVAGTPHGLYRLTTGRWQRWSDVSGRVERVVVDDSALYATIASGVVRLPAA